MQLPTGRDKILLTLMGKEVYEDETLVPYSTCQQGLSEAIDVSQARVAQLVNVLKEENLLRESKKHIVGLKRRRKAYFLTPKGYRRGEELQEEMKEKRITVQTENSEESIRLGSIEKYIDSNKPILTALNNIDDEGVIDLTESEEKSGGVFVDREKEMERLNEAAEKLSEEGNKLLFVKGEAGIGKTSLISEFKNRHLSGDFNFLSGRAYFDNAEPYLPFKEVFEKYRVEEGSGDRDLPFYQGGDTREVERESIFYDTGERIEAIASNKPLVIFLDDLQWADRATLQLLYYLSDNTRDSPLLCLCTFRPEEVSENHPLNELIQRLSRSHVYDEIKLEPLDWQDTRVITQNLIGTKEVPDGFVKLIHRITDGNPLFIKECIEQMLEEGSIDPQNEIYPMDREDIEIPRIINDIIDKRIKRLDQGTKEVLKLGSVIGEKVPFALISSILNMDDFELLNHLDILVGADLWDDEPNEDIFYFSHGLIQLTVYENIPGTIRKKYHLKIAEAIEDVFHESLEDHLSELGLHFERGGELSESVKYYIKAGKKADDVYAHEDAIQMYKKSLSLLGKIGESSFDAVELLERLADSYKVIGKYEESRDHFYQGIERTDDPGRQAKMYWKIGGTHLDQGDYDSALEALEIGLDTLDEENYVKCRLLDRKGWALMREGEFKRVQDIFEEEKKAAERIGNDKEIAQAVHNLGALCLKRSEYDDAKDRFQRAIELWKRVGDESGLSSSYNNLGIVYSKKGELDRSLEYLNKSLDIAQEIGDIRSASLTLLNIGEEYYYKGRLDKALERYKESLSAKKKIEDREGTAFCHNYIGEVYREKGMISDAKESHEEGLSIAEDIKNQKMVITSLLSLAQDHLGSSEIDEGFSLAHEALEKTKESGLKSRLYKAKRMMGKAYRLDRDFEKAERELNEALEEMGKEGDKKETGKVLYELGLLWMDRDEDTAKDYLTEALETFEEIGMEMWMEKTEDELEGVKV